jgi:hypothetical protein
MKCISFWVLTPYVSDRDDVSEGHFASIFGPEAGDDVLL